MLGEALNFREISPHVRSYALYESVLTADVNLHFLWSVSYSSNFTKKFQSVLGHLRTTKPRGLFSKRWETVADV